jgi:hypothetical protein
MKDYSQFHLVSDTVRAVQRLYTSRQDIEFTYTFENFFHPFVGELIQKLNQDSLPGLLDPKYHQSLKTDFFNTFYTLLTSELVKIESFPKGED